MTRWKASFLHLLLSFAIVGSAAAYIIYFWYPPALLQMARADKLLMLVGGIDLIVGPLLTLLVYKQGKPSLRMDLSVIALVQAAFLYLGLSTMYQSRPVFLVASPTMFDMVFANDIQPAELAKAREARFQSLSIAKPQLVGALLPTDTEERNKLAWSALAGGSDLQMLPKYYVDYSKLIPDILAHAQPLQATQTVPPHTVAILVKAAESYGRSAEEVRYLPLGSTRGYAVMLIDAKTGTIVGPVNVEL